MPELPEIEFYRRHAEAGVLKRTIHAIDADDAWFLKKGTSGDQLQAVLTGASFVETGRIGKLLLLTTDRGDVLGLRFGMTGTLMVDGEPGGSEAKYGSHRYLEEWNRFAVAFEDGGTMAINDPRRLGGVELDPDLAKAGIDALTVTPEQFAGIKRGTTPLKAWLLDQAHLAGVGNLIADELLWRAALRPTRPANSLSRAEVKRMGGLVAPTVEELIDRGGCHLGDLISERKRDGRCPRDVARLQREKVGGRTTYFCPKHQQ